MMQGLGDTPPAPERVTRDSYQQSWAFIQGHEIGPLDPALAQDDYNPDEEMGDQLEEDGDDVDVGMQNLLTFEGSLRNFVGARDTQKGFLSDSAPQPPRPRRIIRRGPRKAAEPTGDVRLRLNKASQAYTEGRLDEAIEYVNDAIRINAEIYRAWTLLATFLEDKGEQKQRLLAMVCAAHLQPKIVGGWLECSQVAVKLLDINPDDAEDLAGIAIMALGQAIKIDPNNIEARHMRAALLLTQESYAAAVKAYKSLVELRPFDLHALGGLVETSVQLYEHGRASDSNEMREAARDAFRRGVDHYRMLDPGIDNPFTWDDLFIYVELLAHLQQYDDVLHETRTLSRWLLGRQEEHYWDSLEDDDREWDNGDERRSEIPDFVLDKFPIDAYGYGLPLRLRTKLAVCRLRNGQDAEAMHHLQWLEPVEQLLDETGFQKTELVQEVASELVEVGNYSAAVRYYEPLRATNCLDGTAAYRAGKCYSVVDDHRRAEECFMIAIESDDADLDARIDARYELAKLYEAARQDAEAYILINEAMELEEDRGHSKSDSAYEDESETSGGGDEGKKVAKPKKKKKSAPKPEKPRARDTPGATQEHQKYRKLRSKQARVDSKARHGGARDARMLRRRPKVFALDEDKAKEEQARSAHLAQQWEIIRSTEVDPALSETLSPAQAWMQAARELIDDFRSYKPFYPWDRYLINMGLKQDRETTSSMNPTLVKMADRLRDNLDPTRSGTKKVEEVVVSYRNVSFKEWLDLFIDFAFGLAHAGRLKEAYAVCDAAKDANVYFESTEELFLIYVAMGACALQAHDEEKCVEVARYLMSKNAFCSDAFRMYAALCRLGATSATWYADTRVQKFTLRQVKYMDAALLPQELKGRPLAPYEESPFKGTQLDVQLLMLYGHILFISNSFTYALNYYVRAHALDPNNAMINISIGQAYVHYALKRQADNRQQLIAQGFSFLHRYYDTRLSLATSPLQRQEAHYNLGRSYHLLGLASLAIEYYKRALRESESVEGGLGPEDLAREVAYNIATMCVVGGDMRAAQAVTDKWMVM